MLIGDLMQAYTVSPREQRIRNDYEYGPISIAADGLRGPVSLEIERNVTVNRLTGCNRFRFFIRQTFL